MDGKRQYVSVLLDSLGDSLEIRDSIPRNEVHLVLRHDALNKLPTICSLIAKSFKAHFTALVANDERSLNDNFVLYYVFSVPSDDIFIILEVTVDPRHMEVPSISLVLEAASWFEREMKDWYGIIAFPNIFRLASHPDWPEDSHHMSKDVRADHPIPRVRGHFEFRHVEGEGVFEIPVGPVHAGIIEPGHFRFSVAGEPIINLDIQLFYTHKGTEKIAEGLTPQRGVFLAERISGDSSFGHALAFCHAIERLSGCEIPQRAIVIRTMLLELERLYNHIGDVGSILLDVGFTVGAALAFELKEKCLALNEILTGSRLLRGVAVLGGVRKDPESSVVQRQALINLLMEGKRAFDDLVDLVMSSSSVLDRLESTGKLGLNDSYRLGIMGLAGRASGIARDYRRDHPHCAYPNLSFRVHTQKAGDVFARMKVRIDEVQESFAMLEQLQHQHVGEQAIIASVPVPPLQRALGYVEGWRGEIVHWVMTDREGKVFRWKIVDPSFHNWRGLKVAVRGNIVPDFPVINKSFNLSYSGNDR